jgi:two-component system nitrate/nitrite sensor histidine kinase NarX
MLLVVAIGLTGMSLSVFVAETVQGSGSAINVAGSLRKQSHRMGSLVLSDAENQTSNPARLRVALSQFETSLANTSLRAALARDPDSPASQTFEHIRLAWQDRLKPQLLDETAPGIDPHDAARHNALLADIDAFVEQIDTMVTQLEADTETRIRQLRTILALALVLSVIVLLFALHLVRKRLLLPLRDLLQLTERLAQGDFSQRARHIDADELGRFGQTFNFMADELSKLYQDLETRVADKTAALTRSNRSLSLLYRSIARLHDDPVAPQTYRLLLAEIDAALDLEGSRACLLAPAGGVSTCLASTLPSLGECEAPVAAEPDPRLLRLPLRDAAQQYGLLELRPRPGQALEPWQDELLDALARHIGIALGTAHKSEQARLLALQEERSVIARELHDSIAQALSYMKIQASLLQPLLGDPERREQAQAILRDLREGVAAAYRQLRELLNTFRLKMDGDFAELLGKTIAEFTTRGGIPIHLESGVEPLRLSANQEIHTLQIIREALANSLRHARARQAWVRIAVAQGDIRVSIEDDGAGRATADAGAGHHGLAIMRERAAALGGEIDIADRAGGGTIVRLRLPGAAFPESSPEPPA